MGEIIEIETERLILRQWRDEDKPLFAKMNAHPEVMKYFPALLTVEESNILAGKIEKLIATNGWGFWAVELISTGQFIGFTGLNQPTYELPVSSCVEIGWRLAQEYWGNGYATEAANASLDFAFQNLVLEEVYSFTAVSNQRSRAVMERLHMINMETNFDHPLVPENHPLREHVLYKIDLPSWEKIRR